MEHKLLPADECLVCGRIEQTLRGENPFFVRELETGYVVIGDHQRFEGYTLLLCKEHATELSQLTPEFRAAFLRDMAVTAEAVQNAFRPDKMNGYIVYSYKPLPFAEKERLELIKSENDLIFL